jgi:(p)ppGpp synthase/HD superfamily hydrolase
MRKASLSGDAFSLFFLLFSAALIMNTDVNIARIWACGLHNKQMYGTLPYSHHLRGVVNYAWEIGVRDPDILAACWLHDAIEDTGITVDQIKETINERVAALVWAVTNETPPPGIDKYDFLHEKYQETPDAWIVKGCDRYHNFKSSVGNVKKRGPRGSAYKYHKLHDRFSDSHRNAQITPQHQPIVTRITADLGNLNLEAGMWLGTRDTSP